MMGASFAPLAAAENAKVTPAATTPIVAGEAALVPMNFNSRGTRSRPIAPAITRKPTARPMVLSKPIASMDPCLTIRVTTVRMMRPRTSSATAAPSTMRASVEASAFKSPNTRAVIPTLVAAKAAPRKSDALSDSPSALPARMPVDIGRTTPRIATNMEARPTRRNSLRSISRPTSAKRMMTPTSARTRRASLGSTIPNIEGPTMMPAVISPRTAGMRIRSHNSAANLARISTSASDVKI